MPGNGPMRHVETIPLMGGIKENDGRGWIQLWYIVRTFVNVTMYLQYNNNIIEKKKDFPLLKKKINHASMQS
jgi:hypothetical protein